MNYENYFKPFRENIIGIDTHIPTPFGMKHLHYADWVASGRRYKKIDEILSDKFAPLIANPHTETNHTGTTITLAYNKAKEKIKNHVNANLKEYVLLLKGSGTTGALNKFARILNLAQYKSPVIFITEMEHYSNEILWKEMGVTVEYIPTNKDTSKPCIVEFEKLLLKYKDSDFKAAAITECSNVTGIRIDVHNFAKIIHKYGGYCFVDFAASAPYVSIDMKPEDSEKYLDAIYFSPHKFLGGPGTSGVLIFHKKLYNREIPEEPGGGTIRWVNKYGVLYKDASSTGNIEAREDGGTPPFLQAIQIALCLKLKEQMGVNNILEREHFLLKKAFSFLDNLPQIEILEREREDRLGIVSFFLKEDKFSYNLFVRLLNDYFGIQVRGGLACAGTYGHTLLNISDEVSNEIRKKIVEENDFSQNPGWVRLSLHPLMTDKELEYILEGIKFVSENFNNLKKDYTIRDKSTTWDHNAYDKTKEMEEIEKLFIF